MKIAIRGGHNYLSKGASALIDETTEDRKVKDSVIKYLKQLGHTVIDVTPGNMDSDSDLVYGVSRANNEKVDLFVSIHFNKAYSSYNGAIGTESWVYSKSDNITLDELVAQRITNSLADLGFKNRGVKARTDLYELRACKMASVIVEVCFVEATEDVALYKKIGSTKIGQTIAEAIANKKIKQNNTTVTKPSSSSVKMYRIRKSWSDASSQKGAFSNKDNAISECKKYNGYCVFDSNGKQIYPTIVSKETTYAEKGTFYFTTAVTVRTAMEENAKTNAVYYAGESVKYHTVTLNKNGYNWVHYDRNNGQTGYLKIKDLSNGESYGYAR